MCRRQRSQRGRTECGASYALQTARKSAAEALRSAAKTLEGGPTTESEKNKKISEHALVMRFLPHEPPLFWYQFYILTSIKSNRFALKAIHN